MKTDDSRPTPNDGLERGSRWPWILAAGSALVVLVALFQGKVNNERSTRSIITQTPEHVATSARWRAEGRLPLRRSSATSAPTAEEVVAGKVNQFGRSRREIVRTIGRRLNKDIPSEVEKFFDAIESGQWEDIDAQWHVLATHSGQYEYSTNHWEHLDPFWPAVLDAYGVAERAHLWPAQKLLDYGEAVLGSLRPGMVYVGGTDNGRWIPELLNETSGRQPHIIVTQNAFADSRYLEYMNTLYGDRFTTLTSDDPQRAFQEYTADAQKRFQHDEQFPDEPKQVRANENIRVVDGKVQVSGKVAVMAINEKLLQMLMQKNPDLSFATQESFPMKGTYADAVPLGPIIELRADGQNAFTSERAAQSLDYWRDTTQKLLSDSVVSGSREALNAYSHDAVAAANLLAAHSFNTEAEQAYRLASQIAPSNIEAATGLSEVLFRTGRTQEARQLLDDFTRNYPKERAAVDTFWGSITVSPAQSNDQKPRPDL